MATNKLVNFIFFSCCILGCTSTSPSDMPQLAISANIEKIPNDASMMLNEDAANSCFQPVIGCNYNLDESLGCDLECDACSCVQDQLERHILNCSGNNP